ncbi:MAG TPA: carboxypeptidase regulatory-like domain-containing protein [Bryobacteraceae bacterium]|jgi:plastocyanin|nr:carboxypeptidase regulatory-like domain-containing protein [Bryobacteraceae bacterium]
MTLRWRICFSVALTAGLWHSPAANAGTVEGKVQLVNSTDPAVRKHKDYSGVVVWLEPASGARLPAPTQHARMIQKNKQFTPHLLVVTVGTTVDFPNMDPIFHNAFSNFSGQVFDISLYPPGTSKSVQFKRAGLVRVFCNIHPAMSAIILVLNSAAYAVTDAEGHFLIAGVAPGSYSLHIFHERALPQTLDRLTRPVLVSSQVSALPCITISESGYIPGPHKNKYGQDYPVSADTPAYSPTPQP